MCHVQQHVWMYVTLFKAQVMTTLCKTVMCQIDAAVECNNRHEPSGCLSHL